MARIVMVVRIIPSDTEVNLEELINRIRGELPEDVELREARTEPLAFGMSVIEAAFTMPEEEGITDKLEQSLRKIPQIGEIDVIMTSRL